MRPLNADFTSTGHIELSEMCPVVYPSPLCRPLQTTKDGRFSSRKLRLQRFLWRDARSARPERMCCILSNFRHPHRMCMHKKSPYAFQQRVGTKAIRRFCDSSSGALYCQYASGCSDYIILTYIKHTITAVADCRRDVGCCRYALCLDANEILCK